jgi:hypothetical protein
LRGDHRNYLIEGRQAMSKLPTAAELMVAAHEGRLMEVPLPFARYRTVGDLPTPDDGAFDAIAWLNDITLNGRHIRNWTDEERRAFAEFFDGLCSALAFYGQRH